MYILTYHTHTHRLCRHQKSNPLWVSLASAALGKKQLDTAEIALAEINEVTKVIIASCGIVGKKDGIREGREGGRKDR